MKTHRTAASGIVSLFLLPAVTLLSASQLSAQCANVWLPGFGIPGVNGSVRATTTWDPDGAGPATPVLVLGGQFSLAGPVLADNIATWDPATNTWSSLGSGMGGSTPTVAALTTLPNGDLVAGGSFTTAGGVSANRIARWNGTSWSALGLGVSGGFPGPTTVAALTTLPNGNLVAGGWFTTAGGVSANSIAQWDGTSWSTLGSGMSGLVNALTTLPNGNLVAAGQLAVGGALGNHIAQWNGTSWSPLGSAVNNGPFSGPLAVYALTTLPNGNVVAGGAFTNVGGLSVGNIAQWNGTSWSPIDAGGPGLGAEVYALTTLPNGDLVAGGGYTGAYNLLEQWNGSSWSSIGSGMNYSVHALTTLPNGILVAGGYFTTAGTVAATGIARWNGTSWSALAASGLSAGVGALATLANGDLVAGGGFTTAGGVSASRIARWNGSAWFPLGSGMGGNLSVAPYVAALVTLANGDLVAGGGFTTAGGTASNFVARWDGASWSALGSGTNDHVTALTTLPNGDLVVGGYFSVAGTAAANRIARWDGMSWSAFGLGLGHWGTPRVHALATLANGDVVAGGVFTTAGGLPVNNIARWDGASWWTLGSGMGGSSTVDALTTLPNGDLVAGGYFTTAGGVAANYIARWDGVSWSALGSGMNGPAYALLTLADGSLVAAGQFTIAGGVAANWIARWNGSTWSPLGSGVNGVVGDLTSLPSGDLVAGGSFTFAGGTLSAYVAQLTTTCPATAPTFGSGCNSSIGPMVLTANTLPWVGSTFRSSCTAMAPGSLGFGLFGFTSPGTALSVLHPAGGVGCNLLASPDAIEMLVPTAGSVVHQLTIPLNPAFVGVVLLDQVLQVELAPTFNITRIASSNGLTLTIGAF